MLVALLFSPHVETNDKYIACDLICCIFLENDLVFPVKSRTLEDLKLIGIDECLNEGRSELIVTAGIVLNFLGMTL